MTAPTHVAFPLAIGIFCGAPPWTLQLLAGGSLLPDIDHPQSAIGRIFFFISYPLNRYFGHRRHIHSLVIWVPFTVIGFLLWQPIGWIGLGAISHCVIDCWNTSGVAMMLPLTEKIFVLASKKYRFNTASKAEFVLMICLGMVAWSGGYIGSMGGMRGLVVTLLGSYDMARGYYEGEGLKICYLDGAFRLPNGKLKKGQWLIIGTEGDNGLAVYDKQEKRIWHIPKDGKFLKARLKPTDKQWQTLALDRPSLIKEGCLYFKAGQKWCVGGPGDMVLGYVVYNTHNLVIGD